MGSHSKSNMGRKDLNQPTPPQWSGRFLRWFCREDLADAVLGDLEELYLRRYEAHGKRFSNWLHLLDVLLFLRPFAFKRESNCLPKRSINSNFAIMFKHTLLLSFRSFKRYKSYFLINLSGLTLGIACSVLVFLIVRHQFSFDNFHSDSERIFRFVTEEETDKVGFSPAVPPAFGPTFRADYSFGDKVARIYTQKDRIITVTDAQRSRKYLETVSFVEADFFNIFNFPTVSGQAEKMLSEPNTALITEKFAAKYFGGESALGKVFRVDNRIDFQIKGVLLDIPDNSDFRSGIYLSYANMKQYNQWLASPDSWGGITDDLQTFTKLNPGIEPSQIELVLAEYVKKYRPNSKNKHHYKLQPLSDVHFNASYSSKENILWMLVVVGFFLILTACLNFINLASAQVINRSKEVGVRKTLGSAKSQLFWQFTTETGLIVGLGAVLAVAISYVALPYINEMLDIRTSIDFFSDFQLLGFLFALIVLVTLASSAYPGVVISGFRPVQALKGKFGGGNGAINLRRVLITTQFVISQVLLIGLVVVMFQLDYLKSSDLGFSKEAVIMLPLGSSGEKIWALKTQLEQVPQIERVSLCYAAPASKSVWTTMFRFDNNTETEDFHISIKGADVDYLSTFDVELAAGRNLFKSDSVKEFLVNETLARKLGFSSPADIVGKTLAPATNDWKGSIVGVVRDFHDQSLQSDINPIVIIPDPGIFNRVAVLIDMTNPQEVLTELEKEWTSVYPDKVYQYTFLDQQTQEFYQTEETMFTLVEIFSFIALFIACIGLYGLVAFMATQKTMEIGIRKVLGASVPQILWIFGKEFTRLIILAFLIAAPLAWRIMTEWLQNYAYGIEMSPWFLVLEVLVVLIIVVATIGFQSIKTAMANPVDSLRTE